MSDSRAAIGRGAIGRATIGRAAIGRDAIDVTYAGEKLSLTAERAVVWHRERALIVADLHLGKESVFGRYGIPIPAGVTESTLARLSALIHTHRCSRLIVLGDFVHAPPGPGDQWPAAIVRWLDGHPHLSCCIVAGNHDGETTAGLLDSRLTWLPAKTFMAPFILTHTPGTDPRGPVVCGHLHPAIALRDGRMRLHMPAFWFSEHCAVLPAFGEFTGRHTIAAAAGDRVWAVADGVVCEVTRLRRPPA